MIERQIEKTVLAVCVLVFAYAMAHWAFASPRTIQVVEVIGHWMRPVAVKPDEVDPYLKQAAARIHKIITEATLEPFTPPAYKQTLLSMQDHPFPQTEPLVSFVGAGQAPLVFEVTRDAVKVSLAELAAATPRPSAPLTRVEREYPRREGQPPADVLAAHVLSTYPHARLGAQWQEILRKAGIRPAIVFAAVEAEIRERRPDGTWGSPRAVSMVRVRLVDARGQEISPPTVPPFNGVNGTEVFGAIRSLADAQWQQAILQPEYWDIWLASNRWESWRAHLPDNPISEAILKQRETGVAVRTPEPRTATPARVAAPSPYPSPRGGPMPEGMTPQEQAQMQEAMRRDMERRTREEMMRRGATPSPVPTARPRMPVPVVTPVGRPSLVAAGSEVLPVPSYPEQLESGLLMVWFHDTGLESLKTYQYRVRLSLVNPLITMTREAATEDDAREPYVKTPWSDWSDPVSVPSASEFFATGHSAPLGLVYAEVFTRALGQWVSKRFKVIEGRFIGESADVKVTDPTNGQVLDKKVDFSTGAVAVRFDFSKVVPRGSIERQTVEMVYLNEKGELQTRVRADDEESSRYKYLKEEVRRARASVVAAPVGPP